MAVSWKDKITRSLKALAKKLEARGYATRVLVVRNSDKSVDGELRVIVPRGTSERDIMRDTLMDMRLPKGTWFAAGARYAPDTVSPEARVEYATWYGKLDVTQWYARTNRQNRAERLNDAYGMIETMHKRWRRKALEIVLRINYNPKDRRPDRKGKKKKK